VKINMKKGKEMIWRNITSEEIMAEQKPKKKDLIKTGNFNVVVVRMGKKQEIPPHPESYAVFFLVLRGSGIFATEQGNFLLKKGSSIYYNKDELRGIKSNEELMLLGVQDPH